MRFRDSSGQVVAWHNTARSAGFSNFLFADQHFRSHHVLRRILSLARKLDYQSLLHERLDDKSSAEFQEESAALRARRPDYLRSEVHRLSLLRKTSGASPLPSDLLGYVIFKTDYFSSDNQRPHDHVYEAVIQSSRGTKENNFIHCGRDYTLGTSAGALSVHGVLYAQQNDLTSVCAHVALRTVLSCLLPEGDIRYTEMNQIVGVDHAKRRVGEGSGLSPQDLERICAAKGLDTRKIVHEPADKQLLPSDYQRELYGIIESQGPALLAFELANGGARHVIPVIGHTFNEDTWVADAEREYFASGLSYFPSEAWLSSYVVHDDNFGPLYCLPRHYLKQDSFRLILGAGKVLPTLQPLDAEAIALAFLKHFAENLAGLDGVWLKRWAVFARQGQLVLRSLLMTREAYGLHLAGLSDWEGRRLAPDSTQKALAALPEKFYMVEASAPELFPASRRKFGEILVACSEPLPVSPAHFLLARLPGVMICREANKIVLKLLPILGHTDLWRSAASP